MLTIAVVFVMSYLLGSIPTSIIFSKLYKGIDIREYGSKNAGATNVFRILGPLPGILVLLIDAAKGLVSVVIISKTSLGTPLSLDPIYLQLLAAVAATLGHVYTVFAGFKGGKGIGTGGGALLGLIPREVGLGLIVFLIALAVFRYVSLGSLMAAIFISLAVTLEKLLLRLQTPTILLVVCWGLTLLVFYTHRENIKRLFSGTERKIGEKVKV
jgi:glycerol-3-phosphate acyltransferase PlsY